MNTIYSGHQIKIRVSHDTEEIDRKYLEDFLDATVVLIRDSFGDLIGIDVQRA